MNDIDLFNGDIFAFESFQTKLKRVFLDHLEQEVLASLNREEERVLQTDQER